jgi:hypothetical protein
MAEIVNLRRVRKRRERDEDARRGAENRAAHGQSRAEKDKLRRERERREDALSQHRREPTG